MFLKLNHQKLEVYQIAKAFTLSCYKLTKALPADEKFSMVSQIRRSPLSVHLNIAEGCSGKSLGERKRYYEISRGSLIEIDAALNIADGLDYLKGLDMQKLGEQMILCFKLLCGMIETKEEGISK